VSTARCKWRLQGRDACLSQGHAGWKSGRDFQPAAFEAGARTRARGLMD